MKSLRCMLGKHTGQKQGGTMMYHCPRCHGDFWQPNDLRHIAAIGDRMIDAGDPDGALRFAREAVEREASPERP